MRLRARVVSIESRKEFTDGVERVTLKFKDGGMGFNRLQVPNRAELQVDQEVIVVVTVMGRPEIYEEEKEAREKVAHGA